MHLPAAAIHRLTRAQSVNKSKGTGRNISASRVLHFPPQSRFNHLILCLFFLCLCCWTQTFLCTFCNMHNSIFVLTVCVYMCNKQIRFHFPSETHQQVKILFKNNNWGKENARPLTQFANHTKKIALFFHSW